MKTLDEVIRAWEICDETVTANCSECPYDIDCENTPREDLRADALFYLKEYKEFLSQRKLLKAKPHIEPISWDELRAMEGKTVRLVYWEGRTLVKIKSTENSNLIVVSNEKSSYISLYSDKQNVTWNAYRKER